LTPSVIICYPLKKGDNIKKELPYHQKHIVELITDLSKRGLELTAAGAGISFERHAIAALLKKGIVREVPRTYKNGSTYTAYELAK
jgi:hypothetical protein